jgi:serine/threonine protein kinase
MAPEIVRRVEYEGRPVDIWSLGILLYALLCGCFPFRAKAYPDLYRRIARGTFAIPDELSAPVKDLLRQLLTVDVDQRVSAHAALRHSWLQVQLVNSPNMDRMRQEMTVLISDKPADDLDEQVLSELVAFGMSRDEIIRLVLSKTHCSLTSLYYLLLENVVAKRRQSGSKRAGPSGLGNFTVNSNNLNNALPGSAVGGGVGAASRRPKSATGLAPSSSYNLATSFANGMVISQPQQLHMYVPGNMVGGANQIMLSPYEVLMQQQQQQQQQQQMHLQQQQQQQQQMQQQMQSEQDRYRPKSASATRTMPQRPLSAYAGRR